MSLFGKKRPPETGLGRGVASSEVNDASSAVIEAEAMPTSRDDEVSQIVNEVSAKPTRAERRAAALEEKARAKAEREAGKSPDAPGTKKSRRALKAEKLAERAAVDDKRPSKMVMIDFYPGMAKEDAIETARHWAMTHMDMPSLCFYYVQKIQDGYAVEVQEGVGKAYLPSVIELAQSNPGRLIIVPMIRRKMTVYYSARLGEFEAQILPELQDPPEMPENPPMQAARGPSMTPVMKQYQEFLVTGMVTAALGGFALVASLAFYAFDPKTRVPPEWRTTEVSALPIMQWPRLQADATDSYVTRLEYQDAQWRIIRQAVGSSSDVAGLDPADPNAVPGADGATPGGAAPDGSMPPAPTIPPPAGASAAPRGAVPSNIPPPAPSAQ